ncbi:MAG: hypothetical protein EOM13_04725 [Clostridia bacterium]|nr:hypothetical protein [Clostridia bacterium]
MNSFFSRSLSELLAMIRRGDVSPTELAAHCIRQIDRRDRGRAGLNSVCELNPHVFAEARRLEDRLAAGRGTGMRPGPLFGLPILIKDNIGTAAPLHTTAGSLALKQHQPPDAAIVHRLRDCGAIILGKTNMTELANYMSPKMPGGYSSAGGQVVYPYDRTRDPWGSSTGSAVAVAAGFCAAAIGTDTSNSIIAAALRLGVAGLRPALGLWPQEGIVPITKTLDTAGPLARSVSDLRLIDQAVRGLNESRPDSRLSLSDLRIAVNIWQPDGRQPTPLAVSLPERLRQAGCSIREINWPASAALRIIMKFEFKANLNAYLRQTGAPVPSLADLIDYNQTHAAAALRYGQSQLLEAEHDVSGTGREPEYRDALAEISRQQALARDLLHDVDLCLMAAPNNVAHLCGLPSVALPGGADHDGLPDGLFFCGLDQDRLLAATALIEPLLPPPPPLPLAETR